MRILFRLISWIGLALTIVPSLLVFAGILDLEAHYGLMLAGMLIWFIAAPLWLKEERV